MSFGACSDTSAIDTNLDGLADLSICYDVSTNSPIYINRGQVAEELAQWHTASVGAFSSNAICNDDGSNITIFQQDLGDCEAEDHWLPTTLGFTQPVADTGYSSRTIWYNAECMDDFDWYDTDGIDANKWSALAVGLHEVGHALGTKHSDVDNAVMNLRGPDNCDWFEHDLRLAFDDADAYRDRYTGINNTTTTSRSAGCDG